MPRPIWNKETTIPITYEARQLAEVLSYLFSHVPDTHRDYSVRKVSRELGITKEELHEIINER